MTPATGSCHDAKATILHRMDATYTIIIDGAALSAAPREAAEPVLAAALATGRTCGVFSRLTKR